MIITADVVFLAGIPLLVISLALLWRRRSKSYLFFFSLFYVYLLLVLIETLFPVPLEASGYSFRHDLASILSHVILRLFYFGPDAPTDFVRFIFYTQLIDNIMLTLPFGFGINFIVRVKPRAMIWLPVAMGLGIEAMQLAANLAVRYPYRVVDINDVWMNAMGVLIGYGAFRLFAWVYVAVTDRLNVKPGGLWAYIYSVASHASLKSGLKNEVEE